MLEIEDEHDYKCLNMYSIVLICRILLTIIYIVFQFIVDTNSIICIVCSDWLVIIFLSYFSLGIFKPRYRMTNNVSPNISLLNEDLITITSLDHYQILYVMVNRAKVFKAIINSLTIVLLVYFQFISNQNNLCFNYNNSSNQCITNPNYFSDKYVINKLCFAIMLWIEQFILICQIFNNQY